MPWARILAYVTGTVNQAPLLCNEYLAAKNRILTAQIKGRMRLSEDEKATLAEIAHRLPRKALEELASTAQRDTILGWYRVANAEDFGVIKLSQKFRFNLGTSNQLVAYIVAH